MKTLERGKVPKFGRPRRSECGYDGRRTPEAKVAIILAQPIKMEPVKAFQIPAIAGIYQRLVLPFMHLPSPATVMRSLAKLRRLANPSPRPPKGNLTPREMHQLRVDRWRRRQGIPVRTRKPWADRDGMPKSTFYYRKKHGLPVPIQFNVHAAIAQMRATTPALLSV